MESKELKDVKVASEIEKESPKENVDDKKDDTKEKGRDAHSTVTYFKSRYAKEQATQVELDEQGDQTDARSLAHLFQTHHQQSNYQPEKHHPHFNHHGPMQPKPKEEPVFGETDESKLLGLVKIREEGDLYASSGKKRGLCMIFENDMFHTDLGLSRRKGSSVDRGLMIDVFSKLQFEVRVYQNLTTGEILDILEKTRFEDHSHADMLAVVVLSHGNEGIVYGYDKAYSTSKLWENFTADMCEDLAGKPKLFFIQACQGSQLDHGVAVKIDEADGGRTETDGFASYRTPLYSDFLIAHSTVNGFYSWRNTVQGSWFIQVLGAALLVNSYKYDLVTILTKVGRVIAREYESNSSYKDFNQKKQMPFIYSTLTNKLYLKQK